MDLVKPVIEKIVYPFMERRRDNCVRRNTAALQALERIPPGELEKLRENKLRCLLLHCVKYVPAYKPFSSLMPEIEATPLAALEKFPLLTKEIFRADPERYIADTADRSVLIANNSGGSSGNPIQFFMDRYTVEQYEAARWRGLSWYGITPGSRCLMIWGNPFDLDKMALRKFRFIEHYLKNRRVIPAYALDAAAMKSHVSLIKRYRPEYIYGYAGALSLFSRLMLDQGVNLSLPLKAVVSTSETLYPDQRQLIEKAFGAPVVNEYGARDGGIITYQCPCGSLHLSAENLIAQVVDVQSKVLLPIGAKGLLTLTDLHNYVQPRLRYQLGDEVALAPNPCPCGRVMPVLAEVYGREDAIFVTIEGRLVHGVAFANCIKRLPEVEAFQIIQSSPDKAKVLIVTKDGLEPPGLKNVQNDYRVLLPGTEISYEMVDHIPPAASGKMRYTIRDFPL